MEWRAALNQKLAALPNAPGVYLYRDARGEVIYIGKARDLRHRVRSYFQEARDLDPKTTRLVAELRDVEYIVTGSEYEAFILESNLVHEHQPRYNFYLKDDKSFPFIRITLKAPFPQISLTRRPVRDGSRYFGPYIPASRARLLIDTVRRTFGIRHCRKEIDGTATRPCCLDYHIKRCLGPCVAALCSREQYRAAVDAAILFLEGRDRDLRRRLEADMNQAAAELRFEDAARLRDRIQAVQALADEQQSVLGIEDDADVFGGYYRDGRLSVQVFHMRGTKVVDRRQYYWEDLPHWNGAEFYAEFLRQFYYRELRIPPRVFVPTAVAEADLLAQWLTERRGRRVVLAHPRRGRWLRLLELAELNARHAFFLRFPAVDQQPDSLRLLQAALDLPEPPGRIEGFDMSTTQGCESVGVMVAMVAGRMAPAQYRRFRIRTTGGRPDDLAAMREVVCRRFRRLLDEHRELPGLILVDGGAGQVAAALDGLAALDPAIRVPVAGLAKRREEVYLPGRQEPLRLPRTSPALKLLQQVRDEAHRFAVSYHRRRRAGASFASPLDDIPGVGPRRKQTLLKKFGSWRRIAAASEADLAKALGGRIAAKVFRTLHPDEVHTHDQNTADH
ncbi:MAG TPA: excinuclease ABC subunit UvrC [Acidobacteriota bacterium]|nr:excinuclease ABC subunit UvrC [Acidobacteriota bacterium]